MNNINKEELSKRVTISTVVQTMDKDYSKCKNEGNTEKYIEDILNLIKWYQKTYTKEYIKVIAAKEKWPYARENQL